MTQPAAPAPAEAKTPVSLMPTAEYLSPDEQRRLATYDTQRRLGLLRVIAPSMLVVVVIYVPFAVQADLDSHTLNSSLQVGIGLVAFVFAVYAAWRRWVNMASVAVFLGVTGVIMALLIEDVLLSGPLQAITLPEFQLLALPIVVAGIFGSPRLVIGATTATVIFTLALIALSPHSVAVDRPTNGTDGLVIYTVPLATQLVLGILTYAATRAFGRMLRDLGVVRMAYAREKELDNLKDQFISSVNHELRTPIMALQGYIELARELGRRGDYTSQSAMLHRSTEAANHLAGLVKSVLNIRHVEAESTILSPATFMLQPVIVSASQLLDPTEAGPDERALHLDVPMDLSVYADEDRVRQVVLNLLSNAAKYSPPGSPIDVTARAHMAGRRNSRNGAHDTPADRQMIEIAIRDHGLGIPPEQLSLLFQRFTRLERDIASQVPGTGLGLAICKAYVEAMGGRIWAESNGQPGEGATFIFTLPAAP